MRPKLKYQMLSITTSLPLKKTITSVINRKEALSQPQQYVIIGIRRLPRQKPSTLIYRCPVDATRAAFDETPPTGG
jgi:hypothetical protein